MPANLTPQYHRAEDAYRKAQTAEERFSCLEEMLKQIPKHKGTEKLQADLKSKLKEAREEVAQEKKSPKSSGGVSWKFHRQGAGTVVIVGGPNSGKSRLLKELTGAPVEVAEYPFTTREPSPGMMKWEDVSVLLVDTPPTTAEHIDPQLVNLVRSADAVLLCMNGASDDGPDETLVIVQQLADRKTMLGDVTQFDDEDYSKVLVKTRLVVTHGSDSGLADRLEYWNEIAPIALSKEIVDLERTEDIEKLREAIYQMLGVIRIYTKVPGKKAEMTAPFTLPSGGTVEDLAHKIHQDLAAKVKHAKVWSQGAADPKTVGTHHPLSDRDIVELHTT